MGSPINRVDARDISPGGAYVFALLSPPVGHFVQLSIQLPGFPGEVSAPRVNVHGRVLRVDPAQGSNESGFSIRNEKVALCAR